ncbi:hypothetical protein [Bifidobacterium bombi]|uniref:hypothetical protein n=1 Tax=Bifidobacterium bombi TaxID=471511 RepID=UPI000AC6AC18|nr:hypothetical protein [Bifidobacterium bombi]
MASVTETSLCRRFLPERCTAGAKDAARRTCTVPESTEYMWPVPAMASAGHDQLLHGNGDGGYSD